MYLLSFVVASWSSRGLLGDVASWSSRGLLGDPTPLQKELDEAIGEGLPSFSLNRSEVYIQGASSLLIKAKDFSLIGNNATIVFAPGYGVVFQESTGVVAQDLTVTFDPPSFTQGRLVAAAGRTFDILIDSGFPLPNASFFTSVETKLQFFDPSTRLRPAQSGSCIVTVIGEESPGVWRVETAPSFSCDLPPGIPVDSLLATLSSRIFSFGYQIPSGYRGGAWWIFNSSRCTTLNVTLLGSSNFAFSEWGGDGGHVYDTVTLTRAPGHLLSSNTDGFHSFSTGVGPTISNSALSFMGDDVMNIHNRVGLVLQTPINDDAVLVIDVGDTPTPQGNPAFPARALADVIPGQDALLISPPRPGSPSRGGGALKVATAAWVTDATLVAAAVAYMKDRGGVPVDPLAVGVWNFSLPGTRVAGVAAGDIVQFDRRAGSGGRVSGCTFSDAYDSCFRLQASGTLLAGNSYARIPGGISISFDPDWLEGSSDIQGVQLLDNVFQDVLWPHAKEFSQILSVGSGVKNVSTFNNTVLP